MFETMFSWFKDWGMQYFGALIGSIKGALMWLVEPGIRSIFTATGLAMTTYHAVINPLAESARVAFGGIPGGMMQWLTFFNIDKVATILISAYLISSVHGYLRIVRRVAEAP